MPHRGRLLLLEYMNGMNSTKIQIMDTATTTKKQIMTMMNITTTSTKMITIRTAIKMNLLLYLRHQNFHPTAPEVHPMTPEVHTTPEAQHTESQFHTAMKTHLQFLQKDRSQCPCPKSLQESSTPQKDLLVKCPYLQKQIQIGAKEGGECARPTGLFRIS